MGCGASRNSQKTYPAIIPLENTENVEDVARATLKEINADFELTSAVEISFTLSIKDTHDVMVVLSAEEETLQEIGRTEVQKADKEIHFLTTFRVVYSFEQQTRFRCDVYEMKNMNHSSLFRQNNLGCAKFWIHEIVGSVDKKIERELSKGGVIRVFAEEMSRLKHKLKFVLGIESRKANGVYSLRVSRIGENRNIPVYITEGVERLPCKWQEFTISVNRFCNGDPSRPALFELIRNEPNEEVLGSVQLTVEELLADDDLEKLFENNKLRAVLKVYQFKYAKEASFLDFVYGGCEISLIIAIDFTRSNGAQNSLKIYHGMTDDKNDYIMAIKTVGEVLQYYDTDKMIPVYGFGAKLPPGLNIVSHCFALNGDIFNPEVKGIPEVLEVYKKTVNEIVFHGPTVFNEVIAEVINYAASREVTQEFQKYFMLLILTDGGINDLKTTTNEIVKASLLPISIVIIGIGNEDFEAMNILDADDEPLVNKNTGQVMERDIVQFVPFNKYKNDLQALAREVLTEIPDQLLEFMNSKGIRPKMPDKQSSQNFGSWAKRNSLQSYEKMASLVASDIVNYYSKEKEEFIQKLVTLGFERKVVEYALRNGISCKSVELAIELINLALNKGKKLVIKDKKNEICKSCEASRINAYSRDCGHLICCKNCVKAYTRCTICKGFIFIWEFV